VRVAPEGTRPEFDPNPHAIRCNSSQYRDQKIRYLWVDSKRLQSRATTDRVLVAGAGVSGSQVRSSTLSLFQVFTTNKDRTL
jgi:hypothetical protein